MKTANIKTKKIVKNSIKSLDKGIVGIEKTKDNIVSIKEKSENFYNNENNTVEYANNKFDNARNDTVRKSINYFNKKGSKETQQVIENVNKIKKKVKNIKSKRIERKNIKKATKELKTVSKKAKKAVEETVKNMNRGRKLAEETAKRSYHTLKSAFKITIATAKMIIAALKSLISLLIAGGWISIIIIILICLIALLLNSIFGIFFSSEPTGDPNNVSMSEVIRDINLDMANKIQEIQTNNTYDNYKIESNRAEWKDILSVYVAYVSKGTNETDVITMNDSKKAILKKIFWDMNSISYEIKQEQKDSDLYEENMDSTIQKILYITIDSKTIDEIIEYYNFTPLQLEQVNELQKEEYDSMWSAVVFGTPIGSPNMVQIALQQIGNVGGEPYWSWYGFNSRVEWCAIFVSWVANQAGIDETVIPKFSLVSTGVNFFKATGAWRDKGYLPQPGDIIFFDLENDGKVNHVGIVERIDGDTIYTIEGNSDGDECKEKSYSINSNVIYGYGDPAY